MTFITKPTVKPVIGLLAALAALAFLCTACGPDPADIFMSLDRDDGGRDTPDPTYSISLSTSGSYTFPAETAGYGSLTPQT
jgi:hypothetical protein